MTITVGTFNTRHGRPPRGLARLDVLAKQCAVLDADVLGLQELDRRVIRSYFVDQPKALGRRLGMQAAWAPARRPILVGYEGNALLARGALSDVSIVELPRSPERYTRVAMMARVELGGPETAGARLSVAVTHLQNHRPEAAAQLPVLLERFGGYPEPRVLLGDLNLTRDEAAPVLEAAGYEVADAGPTSPAHAPYQQIDFVAVRGLAVTRARVLPTIVSDHRPLVVDLRQP